MIAIPDKYTLDSLATYLDKVLQSIPDVSKVTVSVLEQIPVDIKTIKDITKKLKEEKKNVEAPFEAARKKAQLELDTAKTGKASVAEPYSKVLTALEATESSLRQLVLDYQKHQEDLNRQMAEEQARLKAEEERLKAEAEAAAVKARKSGAEKDAVAAFQAEQKAIKAENKAAAVVVPEVQKVAGVAAVKRISFEVEDILKVPAEYVEYMPNMVAIKAAMEKAFPFVTHMEFEVDLNQVPDKYMYDQPIADRIITDLRKGIEIPGIKKTFVEHVAIR